MDAFWSFARQMLRYKAAWAAALTAACLDAASAFGGFGMLTAVISMMFDKGQTNFRQIVLDRLADPGLQRWIGDQTALFQWLPENPFQGLALAMGVIFLLAVLGSVFRFVHQFLSITIAQRVSLRIRAQAFHRVLHAPMESLWQLGSADAMSRIVQDSSRLSRGFSTLTGKAVRDVFMGLVFVIWALLYSWELTLIFLLGMIPIGLCIRKFGKRIRRASKYALQGYARMIEAMQESIQNAAVVRTHNAEGYERRRFHRVNRELYQQEMRARTARALSSPVIELIGLVGVIAVVLVAAYAVFEQGSAQPADMLFVLLALAAAGGSVKPLANLNNDLQEAAAGAARLKQTIESPTEPHRRDDWLLPPIPRHRDRIFFESVTYAYPGKPDEPALRDFSLQVSHGQTVALVGTNGSGKTTALSLLTRLMLPSHGRVLIDCVDIAGGSLRSLRKQVAVVPQHAALFAGTVADNIAYGRRYSAREHIIAAARLAHAHEFIEKLPQGYDTVLGESGTGLSGGQKQRLCIARAILRDPAILILDEATSQIDAESEAKIHAAMKQITQGRTTFVIAHRLSTVVDADLIVVMDAGRIVDQGRHDELLERCTLYQSLVRHQMTPA
jgi:ABC-type multidrug transport system fused ATPase/permease subunit